LNTIFLSAGKENRGEYKVLIPSWSTHVAALFRDDKMRKEGRAESRGLSPRNRKYSSASFPFDSIHRSILRSALENPVSRKFPEVVLGRTNVVLFGPE